MLLQSCVDPYYANITKFENLIVIDGELSNIPGPYEVKLSRTFDFKRGTSAPISNAKLKIIDNHGSETILSEIREGVYSTIGSNFQGEVGKAYKLQILFNNEIFESEFEKLLPPVSIDSIYWEYENEPDMTEGIRILLDSHDDHNNTRYYGWNFEETWKFRVPIDVNEHPEWKECYKNESNTDFIIGTSINRNNDIINNQSLTLINENTNRLYYRYTINVKQYSFSQNQYKYFKDIITINDNQGSMFDQMPSSIFSNVKNITNKDKPVLGYFLVAGISQKRIFIDRSELPLSYEPTDGFDDCLGLNKDVRFDTSQDYKMVDITTEPEIDSLMKLGFVEYERFLAFRPDSVISVYLSKPNCFNCTLNGKIEIPDFWVEKEEQ